MISRAIRILGIDPGLRRTGWGVIESDGNRLVFVGCGSIDAKETLPLWHQKAKRIPEDFALILATVHMPDT